jgi:hypothetical protein
MIKNSSGAQMTPDDRPGFNLQAPGPIVSKMRNAWYFDLRQLIASHSEWDCLLIPSLESTIQRTRIDAFLAIQFVYDNVSRYLAVFRKHLRQ